MPPADLRGPPAAARTGCFTAGGASMAPAAFAALRPLLAPPGSLARTRGGVVRPSSRGARCLRPLCGPFKIGVSHIDVVPHRHGHGVAEPLGHNRERILSGQVRFARCPHGMPEPRPLRHLGSLDDLFERRAEIAASPAVLPLGATTVLLRKDVLGAFRRLIPSSLEVWPHVGEQRDHAVALAHEVFQFRAGDSDSAALPVDVPAIAGSWPRSAPGSPRNAKGRSGAATRDSGRVR